MFAVIVTMPVLRVFGNGMFEFPVAEVPFVVQRITSIETEGLQKYSSVIGGPSSPEICSEQIYRIALCRDSDSRKSCRAIICGS